MDRILYSKLSNNRVNDYQIMTQIIKNENGGIKVVKKPLTEKAKAHLSNSLEKSKLFYKESKGTVFQINIGRETINGLEFDYIQGKLLDDIITKAWDTNDISLVLNIFKEYYDNLRIMAVDDFVVTDEFINIFGAIQLNKPMKSCRISNIDMVMGNIIINDKWNIIDSEWLYGFPIPVNYIVYRTIIYSNVTDKSIVLDYLDIDNKERLEYQRMEDNFQKKVHGNEVVLSEHLRPSNFLSDIQKCNQQLIDKNKTLQELLLKEQEKLNLLEKEKQDAISRELDKKNTEISELLDEISRLKDYEIAYEEILKSNSWTLTRPLRGTFHLVKKLINSNIYSKTLFKGLKSVKDNGITETYNKAAKKLKMASEENTGTQNNQVEREDVIENGYWSIYQNNEVFDNVESEVKALAFYLPQFHCFPENDNWWGKGFTEWTNTKKAVPQYLGHYQPREPHNDIGYYDLSHVESIKRQCEMAKQHGLYGFCIYYYWFSGKRLMEKPLDILLTHPEIDINYCLCWANENWTRRWDGQEQDVLIKQDYSEKDPYLFINDLKKYLDDKRYIRVNGKPVVIVYNPATIPNVKNVLKTWKDEAVRIGIGEITIWICTSFGTSIEELELQGIVEKEIEFPPHGISGDVLGEIIPGIDGNAYNYSKLVNNIITGRENTYYNNNIYRTVMLGWDNTARRKNGYSIFNKFDLKKYYDWLKFNIKNAKDVYKPEERFVFINAWNEWAEGTYLEPDAKYGYAMLNTTSKAIYEKPFDVRRVFERNSSVKSRLAVQAHVFYVDVADEFIEYLNNISEPFDCYISTDSVYKSEKLLSMFISKCRANRIEVMVVDNRGRDVAPFLIQMKKIALDYDYLCHIHSKRSKHSSFGDIWRKYLLDNLLGDKEYVSQIISTLDNNIDIGLVYPEYFSNIREWIKWGGNKEITKDLMNKLSVSIALPENIYFPAGDMFWVRVKAVKEIFDYDWEWSDFPNEEGQVDGTIMHAIERSWSILAENNGYKYLNVNKIN